MSHTITGAERDRPRFSRVAALVITVLFLSGGLTLLPSRRKMRPTGKLHCPTRDSVLMTSTRRFGCLNDKVLKMIRTNTGRLNLKKFSLLFITVLLLTGAGAQELNPLRRAKHSFIVVAHRGDHEHAPANTLAAFKNAIDAGADYVEIDLRTTVDSQLVIMHDASVDRMTGGHGQGKDMTAESLRPLQVRDKTHPEWGEHEIPAFRQVLELCKNRIYIYLDFKDADPAAAYREIVQMGMERQVVGYINAERQFGQWRTAAPRMPLMVSLPGAIRDTAAMKDLLNRV